MRKFIIEGKLPSLNDYCRAERSGYHAANNFKKKYQAIIRAYIKKAGLKPMIGPVFIEYRYYEKNKRRDKDNIAAIAHKFIQDSLVQCRIIENDGWDNVAGFTDIFDIDTRKPRIEVILHEV